MRLEQENLGSILVYLLRSCGDERFGHMIAVDDEVVVRVAFKVSVHVLTFGIKKFEFMVAGSSTEVRTGHLSGPSRLASALDVELEIIIFIIK